ncbi:hypothetical protein Enr13x_41240 [Stieleria neptunia]|uniref:Uncharacterized protein n=1 Tax=Stieleria neptunia TaxID=2527979 RepID=A0A518HTS7_9BACT|nr:hypothetical protein Enr13x_41240 [Stieleria neptunia]
MTQHTEHQILHRTIVSALTCLAMLLATRPHAAFSDAPYQQFLGTFETPREAIFSEWHTKLKTFRLMGLLSYEMSRFERTVGEIDRGALVGQLRGAPKIDHPNLLIPTFEIGEERTEKEPPFLKILEFQSYREGSQALIASPDTIRRISERKSVRPSDVLIRTSRMPSTGIDPMGKSDGPIPSIHQFQNVRWALYADGSRRTIPFKDEKEPN